MYAIAADLVLVVHVALVGFVVMGLVLVYLGKFFSWRWVRNPWFRLLHCATIVVVAIQAWLGLICPLTIWEMQLRRLAGQAAYEGSFITHWMSSILYYHAPAWVFTSAYTVFGVLVLASWFIVRPRRFSNNGSR